MPGPEKIDAGSLQRILIVRPRFLGDVCLTLPVVDAIRAVAPQAKIGYVIEREWAPLLEGDPRVDELIETRRKGGPLQSMNLVGRIRKFAPEVVFDLFSNPRTAQWSWLSGAKVRVGYPNKGWRSSLYTHHTRPRTLSAIGFHLASLEAVGWGEEGSPWSSGTRVTGAAPQPRLVVREEMRAEARAGLRELGIREDAPLVGFHPGARWPTRRWGAANYAELAGAWLASRPGAVALITAGPGEEGPAREVAGALGSHAQPILGWPLARFVALQSMCRAFVCGDSGPMHTAASAGTPTLGILSRNRPAMFFPYLPEHGHRAYYARVECSPCHRDECPDLRCLRRLTPTGAWDLLQEMLSRTAGREPNAAPAAATAGA